MKKPWFESWFDSPYYHVLYKKRDEAEAKAFIDRLLRELALPVGAAILDLACGKGRHSKYLAEQGFEVVGLDISPASIQFARQFETPQLTFFVHDMRRSFRSNFFDATLNIFTSFGYFETEKDHLDTLKNAAAGLRPGGLFVLDFFNSELVKSSLIREERKTVDGIEFLLKKSVRDGHIFKTVEFTTGGREFSFREKVRLYTLADFENLFAVAGLRLEKTFGSYELDPFEVETSKRLILIGKRTTAFMQSPSMR